MQEIKVILTDSQYTNALANAAYFIDHEPAFGSKDAEQFEELLALIEAYEAKHYPVHASLK
jgi:HTH-type transcriptional regulator/antitoxin HigA